MGGRRRSERPRPASGRVQEEATLIDSSVVVDAQRGRLDLADVAARSSDATLAISAIGASELLVGLQLMRDGGKRAHAEAFVEAVLADLPVVPVVCNDTPAHLS